MLRSILLPFSRSFRLALLGLGIRIEIAHFIDPVFQAGATAGSKGSQVQGSLWAVASLIGLGRHVGKLLLDRV